MTDTPTKPAPQWAISEQERRRIGKRRNAITHGLRITYLGPARTVRVTDDTLHSVDTHLQGKVQLGTEVGPRSIIRHLVLLPHGVAEVLEWKNGRLTTQFGRVDPTEPEWRLDAYILAVLIVKKELGAHIECVDHPKPPAANRAAFAENRRRITNEDREFFRNGPGRSPDLRGPAQRALHYPKLRFIEPAPEEQD